MGSKADKSGGTEAVPAADPETDAGASPAPPPAAPPPSRTEPALLRLAFLLAAAAMAAAIVGARVSMLSGEAAGKWESSVRLEVKRSAGAQESVRYLYDVEVPLAISILRARLIETGLESLPPAQAAPGQAIAIEKGVQAEVLKALEPGSDLTQPVYALPNGGVDLGKRLADIRAGNPDQLTLDPEGRQAQGDALAQKADRLSLALVPFGLCALLGALAQAFGTRRRRLLQCGWAAFALGAVLALAVEVLL
jgi:hypothetical protein